jgi:hypothetical protein
MASLQWQACGTEFLLQCLHAPCRQTPAEERPNFRLPDMQEFRHRARIMGFQERESTCLKRAMFGNVEKRTVNKIKTSRGVTNLGPPSLFGKVAC